MANPDSPSESPAAPDAAKSQAKPKRPKSAANKPVVSEPLPKPPRKPTSRRSRKSRKKTWTPAEIRRQAIMVAVEALALTITAIFSVIAWLGMSAEHFSGTSFFGSLLPFAAGMLAMIVAAACLLLGWWRLRVWLKSRHEWLTPMLASTLALAFGMIVVQDRFALAYGHFRTLVGGKEAAGRQTISHQVYAAYRRHGTGPLKKMIARAQSYRSAVHEAAEAFQVDAHLLMGIAAAESSFLPRTSQDGGQGLFQITQVPKQVMEQARSELETDRVTLDSPKHNAFVAAATFKHYLAEMHDDLFLALLAYNIGPANGGLRFIMQQYGATDFATIQPYLQTLPRDYPIRVLAYALAFRLWQQDGKLLAYEEGKNAFHIQRVGIPGLQEDFL